MERSANKKSSVRYVAAFRTYAWDAEIAELARRFFASVPSSRQVVLVDETRGPIEVPGYEKISHTADNVYPGLPNYPRGRSLWFNVDYGIYALHRELPGYSHYLLSESDLAVNLSLEPMMQFAIDQKVDLIAHQVRPSTPDWFWHPHGLLLSERPWRSLLFFMVLSHRAITRLLAARKRLAKRFSAGEIELWPFCEAFLPTVLKDPPDMRFVEVSEFATTDNLNFRPWISLNDPRANQSGSLAHSVLGGKRFVETLLAKHPVRDFFREGSELRTALLSEATSQEIGQLLYHAFARHRDYDGMSMLWEESATQHLLSNRTTDLAFCKPALSSSVSAYSRYKSRELDACGANGDWLPHDLGFHTKKEDAPWWMVDLLWEHTVEEVAIVNRLSHPQRFRMFRIESSCDGDVWTDRFTQLVPCDVSSDAESPWRVRFDESFPARYVRIVLLGVGPLHLRRVQVFGRVIPPQTSSALPENPIGCEHAWPVGPKADLALCRPAVTSSTSDYSHYDDPERDACRANGECLPHDFGFHTRKEANPWWMVDLLDQVLIEEVTIVNRRSHPERFRTFAIETSCDGETWVQRFNQASPIDVASAEGSPWRVKFDDPFEARYLRIVLIGSGPLHLRRVQAFGRVPFSGAQSTSFAVSTDGKRPWPVGPLTDLALCRPALTSSVSRWSRHQDPERDAAGANGEEIPHDYGFHTEQESEPWWRVDLLGERLIEEISIVNRRSQPKRFERFRIESSADGELWMPRFSQSEAIPVSSDTESPWRMRFEESFMARFIRIVVLGEGPLHLRRVQIFGRVFPGYSAFRSEQDALSKELPSEAPA